jgi:hypothetical protein
METYNFYAQIKAEFLDIIHFAPTTKISLLELPLKLRPS